VPEQQLGRHWRTLAQPTALAVDHSWRDFVDEEDADHAEKPRKYAAVHTQPPLARGKPFQTLPEGRNPVAKDDQQRGYEEAEERQTDSASESHGDDAGHSRMIVVRSGCTREHWPSSASRCFYDERMPVIAYIDRYYSNPPPWSARPRHWYDHSEPNEWCAFVDGDHEQLERWFDGVDEAIAWARPHAPIVLVRLGNTEDTFYSAGLTRANQRVDGTAGDYPDWPPDNWPDYKGPASETRGLSSEDLNRW
jgi:hypothetical protein